MPLEDFFTLTEMKDGLTSLARVEELLSVMKKENDSVVKNVGEATRQWSTVASTLAATQNKDCLDLFIQLDGLYFLDQWLQEVQKCNTNISDNLVEESITALLAALEKLPIENERLVSCGINVTVKNLCDHRCQRVQDRARALSDDWNQLKDNGSDYQDLGKGGACTCQDDECTTSAQKSVECGCLQHSAVCVSPLTVTADEDKHLTGPSGDEFQHSSCDGSHSQSVEDTSAPTQNQADEEDGFQADAPGPSIMPNPCQESPSIIEDSSLHPVEGTTCTTKCNSPVPLHGNVEDKSLDVPELKGFTDDVKGTDLPKGSQDKSGREEISTDSESFEPKGVSSTDAHLSEMEHVNPIDVEAKETELILKRIPHGPDSDTLVSTPNSGVPKHSTSTGELNTLGQGGGCYSNVIQDLPSNGGTLRKTEDMETFFSRMEDIGAVNDVKEFSGESSLKVGSTEEPADDVSKLTTDTIDERKSDIELEYGVDDALEVARQVAKEVEREVVDYREPFCSSSSEKNSEGGVVQPGSPNSINGEQDQPLMGPQIEVPAGQNISDGSFSPRAEEHLINSKNTPENSLQDPEASQMTKAAQEPADNSGMGMCSFDLNEEFPSEEMDRPTTPISAPIPVVAASKAAASPGLPYTPLHFEGSSGWKGSAATSAFRPASPRRTVDAEKTLSIEGSSHSSKQRQDALDIDLNVAGVDDDGVTDPVLAKQIPVSSGLPCGEPYIEVNLRREGKLKLDLNCVDDNEDAPLSDGRMEGQFLYHHRNGHRSSSPASASSSRQHLMWNINLNDSPSFFDDLHDHRRDLAGSSTQDMNVYGGVKVNDPVISIMGKRVEVNRNEFVSQTRSFMLNGQVSESVVEADLARSGGSVGAPPAMAYTPSSPPLYGAFTVGPSMSVNPVMYGPSHMVDSRGASVVPQGIGSPAVNPPLSSRPPFLMSMAGPPSVLNRVGPMQPGLDLNSRVLMLEDRSWEPEGSRQLFVQGQGGTVDGQLRSASQSLNSGIAAKRKEPDGGWDSHQGGQNKRQPPWR